MSSYMILLYIIKLCMTAVANTPSKMVLNDQYFK